MFDKFKPGQMIRCTVVKAARTDDDESTLARLMRQDPDMRRTLKSAQEYRLKTLVVRSRGKRPWAVRRPCAKYALPMQGATWTMPYTPLLAPDMRAVAQFLKVEAA